MGRKLKAFGVVLGKPFRPGDFFSGLLRHMISSLWRRRTAFFPTQNTSVAIGTALPPSVLIVLLL